MYDRAPRSLSEPAKDIPEHVGPGAYEPHHRFTDRRPMIEGYAPFASMAPRTTFLDVPDTVILAPGPGHYYPEMVARERAKGGSSIANMEQRFRGRVADTPGPGTYSTDLQWIKPRSVPLPDEQLFEGTGHITWKRKLDPPSIPSPGKSFGYEEGGDGALVPQAGPEKDDSLGPAYYKSDIVSATIAEKRYKGVHWSKRTANRFKFSCKDNPGPGSYNPHREPVVQEKFTITESGKPKKFESRIPRYHELIPMKEEKKNLPGPGSYNIKSSLERPLPIQAEGVDAKPFGSTTKRFIHPSSAAPAPGQYDDTRNAFESLRKISGMKKSPFGQTSSRFDRKKSAAPGPGTYNVDVMTSLNTNIQKRAHMSSSTKGAFGSSAVRTLPYTKHEDKHLPGPSHYMQDSNVIAEKSRRANHATSVFASTTERIRVAGDFDKDIPPPGSYNVDQSYQSSQTKKASAQPRTLAGQIKAGSFLSSSARFAPPRDVLIKESDPLVPGPGAYDPQHKVSYMKGTLVSQTPRFVEKPKNVPGPGHYSASVTSHSMVKPSFNVSLNNPALSKEVKSRAQSKQMIIAL